MNIADVLTSLDPDNLVMITENLEDSMGKQHNVCVMCDTADKIFHRIDDETLFKERRNFRFHTEINWAYDTKVYGRSMVVINI